jgi:TetR/AcrR family fatty acid metabolism transcriptional regulator
MKDTDNKPGKRELILRAAVKVFSSKGYHNTRMEEIAAAAGIGKGTIYEYFSSKLQLFQAMLEGSLQYYFELLNQESFKMMPLQERLRILIEAHCRFSLEKKDLARTIFCSHMLDDELHEWAMGMHREKQKQALDFLEQSLAQDEVRQDVDLLLIGLILASALTGLGAVITMDGWEVDPARTADQLSQALINGIKKQAEGAE